MPEQRWRSAAGQHLPFALVLGVTVLGLVRIVQYHWRQGVVLIGLALLIAALLRVLVTDEQAGLIAIRSRSIDALLYSGFGFAVIVVAMTIIGGPLDR
ncbi:DUF3017 domain-containing protein [Saccharothrix coeruleofusca]|uniref:DUF3017 family protein n=1 Tax=Saccharothrix coeruleofusca TaxID=33919 RepID=A0A918AMV3_9PSEU|nr:DUF3017 domain-containing protein [Saccharothrix coeruleofusca]GGP58904.1 hypothetical protein GCM10010185_34220 [Saccharothrix coeruleofusca]